MGKTTAEDSVSLKNLLVDIMRTRYPDIAAYQNGQRLYNAESPIIDSPLGPVQTPWDHEQGFYINTSDVVDSEAMTFGDLISIEPVNGMDPQTQELLNQGFEFFNSDIPEVDEPAGEVESNILICTIDFNTNDSHDAFIMDRINNGTNTSRAGLVYYIQNGEEYVIRSYKTLEVMLVERGLEYSDIRKATEEDFLRYDLTHAWKAMPSLSAKWGYQIRFQSGYKPVAPFKRDPADYYKANEVSSLGTPYLETVYMGQSYKEKLRTMYEGKLAVYDIFFDSTQTTGNSATPNPNFGQPTGLDVGNIRMMTLGYWKWLDSTNVLRLYNDINELGADVPSTRVPAVLALYKAGGVKNFEAVYTNPIKKKGGTNESGGSQNTHSGFLVGWNDFPHISSQNTLDIHEYRNYLDISNNGNPFEIEFMKPYEPAGSIRYYSAGSTQQLAEEATEELGLLENQLEEQYQLNALHDQIHEDLDATLSEISLVQSGQYLSPDHDADINRLTSQQISFVRDVHLSFNTNADRSISETESYNKQGGFVTERLSNGQDLGSDPNIFRSAMLLPQSSLTELDRGLADWIGNNKFWYGPTSPFTVFGPNTFRNLMFRHPNGVQYDPLEHTLVESLMEDNRLAYALSSKIPFAESLSWFDTPLSDPHPDQLYPSQQISEYGTLTNSNTPIDNYISAADHLTRHHGVGSTERQDKLTQLETEFQALHDHANTKSSHRYRSQIIALLHGHNDDPDAHRGYLDIYAEYLEVRDVGVGGITGEALLHDGNRSIMFTIYWHIAWYRYKMRELGYNIIWPQKSYSRIIKYVPELAEDVELYFTNNIFSQEYSDEYQHLIDKYHESLENTEVIFNLASETLNFANDFFSNSADATDLSYANPFQQYHYATGPTETGISLTDYDYFYGWMRDFGPSSIPPQPHGDTTDYEDGYS